MNNMENIIPGIIFVVMGMVFTAFSQKLAKKTADLYDRLLHARFSEKGYHVAFLVVGLLFLVFGLLSLFGVIRFE